ncbi:MAG: hypothetical protein ABR581_00570 [Thermoleophilaceae bacterium]
MRLQRAAFLLAAAVAAALAAWYVRGRGEPAGTAEVAERPRRVDAEPTGGDPLDHLAAEVEARSDASDVVSVVEDLLTAPAEEQRDPG